MLNASHPLNLFRFGTGTTGRSGATWTDGLTLALVHKRLIPNFRAHRANKDLTVYNDMFSATSTIMIPPGVRERSYTYWGVRNKHERPRITRNMCAPFCRLAFAKLLSPRLSSQAPSFHLDEVSLLSAIGIRLAAHTSWAEVVEHWGSRGSHWEPETSGCTRTRNGKQVASAFSVIPAGAVFEVHTSTVKVSYCCVLTSLQDYRSYVRRCVCVSSCHTGACTINPTF